MLSALIGIYFYLIMLFFSRAIFIQLNVIFKIFFLHLSSMCLIQFFRSPGLDKVILTFCNFFGFKLQIWCGNGHVPYCILYVKTLTFNSRSWILCPTLFSIRLLTVLPSLCAFLHCLTRSSSAKVTAIARIFEIHFCNWLIREISFVKYKIRYRLTFNIDHKDARMTVSLASRTHITPSLVKQSVKQSTTSRTASHHK